MSDLTVIILTKNEAVNLRKCVASFRGCAKRFVVVDSFSTDETEALCRKLGSELHEEGRSLDFYQHRFIDYSSQLNWGLQNTSIDTGWTMRMDADEELTSELAQEIMLRLEAVSPPANGIILRRRMYFMGKWIKHGGRYPELLLRIFRTGKAFCEMKIMDEHMVLTDGTTVSFQHDLIDNNRKSLDWWINKHNWYSNREVRDYQQLRAAKTENTAAELSQSSKQAKTKRVIKEKGYYKLPKFFRASLYFFYRYYLRLGFLDGTEGRIYHFLQAYWYRFLVDAKMYECEKNGTEMGQQGDLK